MSRPVELFSRVLGLLEQPDWPAVQVFVAAHTELLSPGADAALDVVLNAARQANGPQRRSLVEGLERLRRALRRGRDIGADRAFADAARDGSYDVAALLPPDFGLMTTLTLFVHTGTWGQAREVVELHPELLDPRTDTVLDRLIAGVEEQEGSAEVAEMLRAHQELLRECRRIGGAAAFEALTEDAPVDPLREAITAFLASPTPRHAQQQLTEHPEVVSERAIAMLERLIDHAARIVPDAVAETMRARLALLRRCVEIGVDAALEEETGGRPHPSETVLAAVHMFVSADTWTDSRQVVDEHPELLSDVADRVLARLEREAGAEGQPEFADLLRTHRRLLERCRRIGVREAFAELGDRDDDPSAAEVERMLRESLDEMTDAGAPEEARVQMRARTAYFLFTRSWTSTSTPRSRTSSTMRSAPTAGCSTPSPIRSTSPAAWATSPRRCAPASHAVGARRTRTT